MKSLLLDRTAWDLVLTASGDIAVASEPYAIAQDVATALRTFKNDCWYDQAKGLPYWQKILGKFPPMSVVRSLLEKEALTVAGVVSAKVVNLSITDRALTGEVEITDTYGTTSTASF